MTKRFALIALLLVVVLGAGPGKGCKKETACADFEGEITAFGFSPVFFVSWTDTVNTTPSYLVEGLDVDTGEWVGMAEVFSDPDGGGVYADVFAVVPFGVTIEEIRVTASCGVSSDPILVP